MNIDDAVAAAQEQAENVTQNAVAPVNTGGGQLAPAGGGAVDMSISGFLKAGGISPDRWLDIRDTGFRFDKNNKSVFESFTGTINFASGVKMFQGARIAKADGTYEYLKTYDGRTEARSGQAWAAALNDAANRSTKPVSPYRGADILIELDTPVSQGKDKFDVGFKVGYTTAVTAFKPFQSFLATLLESGEVTVAPDGETMSGEVSVKVDHETMKNANYEWSIAVFSKA